MEPVHVLGRVDRVDHQIFVQVARQWQLNQDAMHRRVSVQLLDQRQQIGLGRVRVQLVLKRIHAHFYGLLALGPDINLRRGVFAHQHNRQAGGDTVFLFQPRDVARHLFAYCRRKGLAVDDFRTHPLFLSSRNPRPA